MEFGYWYNAGLVGAGVFFAYQQWRIRERKPQSCFDAFLNNHYVGYVGLHRHPARVRVPRTPSRLPSQ